MFSTSMRGAKESALAVSSLHPFHLAEPFGGGDEPARTQVQDMWIWMSRSRGAMSVGSSAARSLFPTPNGELSQFLELTDACRQRAPGRNVSAFEALVGYTRGDYKEDSWSE